MCIRDSRERSHPQKGQLEVCNAKKKKHALISGRKCVCNAEEARAYIRKEVCVQRWKSTRLYPEGSVCWIQTIDTTGALRELNSTTPSSHVSNRAKRSSDSQMHFTNCRKYYASLKLSLFWQSASMMTSPDIDCFLSWKIPFKSLSVCLSVSLSLSLVVYYLLVAVLSVCLSVSLALYVIC